MFQTFECAIFGLGDNNGDVFHSNLLRVDAVILSLVSGD